MHQTFHFCKPSPQHQLQSALCTPVSGLCLLLRAAYRDTCHCHWLTLKLTSTGCFSAHCVETSGGHSACSAHTSAVRSTLSVVTTFWSSLLLTSELPTPTAVRRHYSAPEHCRVRSRQKDTPCVMMTLIFCWRAVGVHSLLIPEEDWLGRDAVQFC